VENSILFPGVVVEKDAIVRDSIIMQETTVKENSMVIKTILDEEVVVEHGCTVGGPDEITVIGFQVTLKAGSQIAPGTKIGPHDETEIVSCEVVKK
jgi:glucose-1-phosphate adenylyltransferase